MTAAEAFLILDRAGLSLRAEGARLHVEPVTLLTAELRSVAGKHKAELLALARDSKDRAVRVVEAASRTARRARRLHSADGGRV